jgi:hypothetical protein
MSRTTIGPNIIVALIQFTRILYHKVYNYIMTPEQGPRRHFTHQQYSPTFVQQEYINGPGGRFERKVEKILFKIKKLFVRR